MTCKTDFGNERALVRGCLSHALRLLHSFAVVALALLSLATPTPVFAEDPPKMGEENTGTCTSLNRMYAIAKSDRRQSFEQAILVANALPLLHDEQLYKRSYKTSDSLEYFKAS